MLCLSHFNKLYILNYAYINVSFIYINIFLSFSLDLIPIIEIMEKATVTEIVPLGIMTNMLEILMIIGIMIDDL